jgi:hypothetical protein
VIRSLGGVVPLRPRALAGMYVGKKQAAPAAAVAFKHCRRLSFVVCGTVRDISAPPSLEQDAKPLWTLILLPRENKGIVKNPA